MHYQSQAITSGDFLPRARVAYVDYLKFSAPWPLSFTKTELAGIFTRVVIATVTYLKSLPRSVPYISLVHCHYSGRLCQQAPADWACLGRVTNECHYWEPLWFSRKQRVYWLFTNDPAT